MTRQEERELLELNSPKTLPDNPSAAGWTPAQIKEKLYAGLFQLYEFLCADRDALAEYKEEHIEGLYNAISDILDGVSAVKKAQCDAMGNVITATYVSKTGLKDLGVVKFVRENETLGNIFQIEKDLTTCRNKLDKFISDNFVDGKAKVAMTVGYVESALKDDLGRVIKNTYATLTMTNSLSAEIDKIKSGQTIVQKAYKDQNGALIDTTYLKIANIINALNDTSTNKALSALQGKVLQDQITAIQNLLQSDDTALDQLQEVVTYIKANRGLIEGVTTGKMGFTDLITNYNSNLANKPVSASVTYALKILIDNIVGGTTKVKKAEIADKVGDTAEEDIVKSINGITPVDGDVTLCGVMGFKVVENEDTIELQAIVDNNFEGTISLEDIGDNKYLVLEV